MEHRAWSVETDEMRFVAKLYVAIYNTFKQEKNKEQHQSEKSLVTPPVLRLVT